MEDNFGLNERLDEPLEREENWGRRVAMLKVF
jgi:hypothetical protein